MTAEDRIGAKSRDNANRGKGLTRLEQVTV